MTNFLVRYRLKRLNCCPPGTHHWVSRRQAVPAESPKHAESLIINLYSLDNKVEVESIEEISEQ